MNALAPLEPTNLSEAMKLAELLASSSLVPKDFLRSPANVFLAMQWGREIGLGALQAITSIAVINGRPTVWGDAALALCSGTAVCTGIDEGVDGEGDARHGWCEAQRQSRKPVRRTFSVADAKKAGLWGKPGPWQNYPDRMLMLRARGFALRDAFPDVLRGVITREEAEDSQAEPPRYVENKAQPERVSVGASQDGSMRQHAEEVAKAKRIERQEAAIRDMNDRIAQRDEAVKFVSKLPIVPPGSFDGQTVYVLEAVWPRAVERALEKITDIEALRSWERAMGPVLEEVHQHNADVAMQAANMIVDRLQQLTTSEEKEAERVEL